MKNIQEVFARMQKTKEEMKKIKKLYREALDKSTSYRDVAEEYKKFQEKKKQIEAAIKNDYSSEFSRLENLKADIDSDKLLLSDIALNQVVKGESIAVKDDHDNEYDPIFSVTFKKRG